jgi:hypothetical protein
MIRWFAAGVGFSVLMSLQAGCASTTAQAPRTIVADDMQAPDIAAPTTGENGDIVYAANGDKPNTMTKDRSAVTTDLHPKSSAKRNHLHDGEN